MQSVHVFNRSAYGAFARCCRLPSARACGGGLLALFLLRAQRLGRLELWSLMLARTCHHPFWHCTLGSVAATVLLPVPRWVPVLPLLALVAAGDLELLLSGGAFAFKLVALAVDLQAFILEFLEVILLCWLSLLRCCLGDKAPIPSFSDWPAAILLALWLLRVLLRLRGLRFERQRARQVLESVFRHALQRPFRASLTERFGATAGAVGRCGPDGASGELGDGQMAHLCGTLSRRNRQFSFAGLQEASEQFLERLNAGHAKLLALRRQELREQADSADGLPATCALELRRHCLLEDSLQALLETPTAELLAADLAITYAGEDGVDGGGLARDWFYSLGWELSCDADSDEGTSLLALGKSSRLLIPRPGGPGGAPGAVGGAEGSCDDRRHSADEAEERRCRRLLLTGRFLALSVVHGGRPLTMPLSPLICKYVVGAPVELDDVAELDPDFFRERIAPLLAPGGLADVEAALGEPLTFVSVPTEMRPQPEALEPGGASRAVTAENLTRYIQLLCEDFLCGEIRREVQCLLQGFWDVFPVEVLKRSGITGSDLSLLLCGPQSLCIREWREHTHDPHWDEGEQRRRAAQRVVSWFWAIVEETLSEEERRLLLKFATGTGRPPLGGFAKLKPPFSVLVNFAGSSEHLPYGKTCINQLVLHGYESREQLAAKLLQALPTSTFGFA
eukprot:TRINITY_DN25485_c0_g1_i1.p1 TRINITY_DN25485_c0_g1~~TRINITY_DN25485_c0_g1_i1.p1  ORF type:complete len:679 (+),score=168.79 TRINITY_DN25485_c0_g1_i1:38-2074(+)